MYNSIAKIRKVVYICYLIYSNGSNGFATMGTGTPEKIVWLQTPTG